jgi:UDP-glucose 4-epimerase
MRVLVTGGAGYIGSVVVEELLKHDCKVVVYDNMSKGHRWSVRDDVVLVEADLLEEGRLHATLVENEIDAVVHMAADSLVGESTQNPGKYYQSNVVGGLSLLSAMRTAGVNKIVFSSTAAVYGEPVKQPIEETDPTSPSNPYGETKLAFERILKWYSEAYDLRYTSLRYFNAAGATKRCGEWHDPETHLIPILLQVARGERKYAEIYGDDYPTRDGTCIRDYIHVVDLAAAHVLALQAIEERNGTYNLGSGHDGYSVLEVINCVRELTGHEIPTKVAARRAGDPAVLIASSDRIKRDLGWSPRYQELEAIVGSAWSWVQDHGNEFADLTLARGARSYGT